MNHDPNSDAETSAWPEGYRAEAERLAERVLAIYPHVQWDVAWDADDEDEQRALLYLAGVIHCRLDLREGAAVVGSLRAYVQVGISPAIGPDLVPTGLWWLSVRGRARGRGPGVPACHGYQSVKAAFGSVQGPEGLVELLASSVHLVLNALAPTAKHLRAPCGWSSVLQDPFITEDKS